MAIEWITYIEIFIKKNYLERTHNVVYVLLFELEKKDPPMWNPHDEKFLFLYSSSFLVEHRSSTRACHLTLFCAVPFISFHVKCLLSNSAIVICRQVCQGLPLFCFPRGFHSSALLTTCPFFLMKNYLLNK